MLAALFAAALLWSGGATTSAQSGCPAYPAFPDANCTGWQHTGVALTNYSGSYTITTPGTVIDGKLINGDLAIRANNVTIRRSKVVGRIDAGYSVQTGLLIEDVEVDSGGSTLSCIGDSNFTARRVNLHGCGQGIIGYTFTLEDSYIHDLYGAGTVHSEAVLGHKGNIVVRHNRLVGNYGSQGGWDPADGGMSSAVSFYTHGDFWGPMSNVVFEQNHLRVGTTGRDYAGFCLYGGGALTSNGTFRDNVFQRHPQDPSKCGYHGTVTDIPTGPGSCWSNNRYEDGTVIGGGNQACAGSSPAPTPAPRAPEGLRFITEYIPQFTTPSLTRAIRRTPV